MLLLASLLPTLNVASSPPPPHLELHPRINNVGAPKTSQWVVQLASSSPSLAACGALCAAYYNESRGAHLTQCQSFTRFTNDTACYGHLDPIWLPLSGVSGDAAKVTTVADSGLVLRPCMSDFDCSYNGECVALRGACRCSQGWTGRRCAMLDVLPVDKAKYGFLPRDSSGRNRSSWGGSVLSNNGVWHMWAARMESHCGIGQWEQNSKIVHATASDVLGPYTERDTVAPVFAHEPCVTRDPRDGSLLMVSVNQPVSGKYANASVFNASEICTCTANCTMHAVGSRQKCRNSSCAGRDRNSFLPIIRTAKSVEGPWLETLSPVLGRQDSNLACWINGSGVLRCNGRGGGLQAAADLDWRNFSSWGDFKVSSLDPMWVSSRPDDEDPMPWMDEATGVWHSIQHNLQGPHMCAGQLCQIGTHQFSLDGGRQWYYTGVAYTSLVNFTDGTSHLFDRRERPHMVFAENSTVPVALSNSVRPGGLDGDRTFTLIQGLRLRDGADADARRRRARTVTSAPWKVCDITQYGAVGDGKTQNIGALRQALADCEGGGVIRVPSGVFQIAPFNLTSNMVLEVEGVLLGTNDLSLVPLMAPFPSMGGNVTRDGYPCRYAPLVGAFHAHNLTITGGGTIDGVGEWWWDERERMKIEPPRLLEVQFVEDMAVTNITLVNSPFWTVHPFASKRLLFSNLTITAQGKGRTHMNTDGIDPDSCQDVLIEDYTYCAGDDAVAIKSGWNWAGQHFGMPAKNITVRRARSGCRGGFTIGSEMSGGVEDVLFEDCVSTGQSGIRISSELGRGGYVKNCTFRNISFNWQSTAGKTFLLHVNQDYKPDNPNKTLSFFSNLTFEGLVVNRAPPGFKLGDITCLEQSACKGVHLSDIHLARGVEGVQPVTCQGVASGSQDGVDPAAIIPGCTHTTAR